MSTKVKFFFEESQRELENKVNEFIQGKNIINISYSTNTVGYNVWHYCVTMYQSW